MTRLLLCLPLLLQAPPRTFTVSGTAKLQGPVPRIRLNKSLTPDCEALHKDPPRREDLVVGPDAGVRWAFVYVSKGAPAAPLAANAAAVQISQAGCCFVPHVAGARVGQPVNFHNGDPMLHNTKGLAFSNKEFNFGQPPGAVSCVTFQNPEVMVKVVCNVHPWMSAWIGVLDHPFFAVTDTAGNFEIKGLPPGNYTLSVWHEGLKSPDQEIVLQADRQVQFLMIQR